MARRPPPLALCALLAACGAYAPDPRGPQPPRVLATLERTACMGACPVYKVTVYDDGSVTWQGERFVEATGERRERLSTEQLAALIKVFTDERFLELDDAGDLPPPGGHKRALDLAQCSDTSHTVVSFERGGKRRAIDDQNCDERPTPLRRVAAQVADLVNLRTWIGTGGPAIPDVRPPPPAEDDDEPQRKIPTPKLK